LLPNCNKRPLQARWTRILHRIIDDLEIDGFSETTPRIPVDSTAIAFPAILAP
jgi:hypothetical protein